MTDTTIAVHRNAKGRDRVRYTEQEARTIARRKPGLLAVRCHDQGCGAWHIVRHPHFRHDGTPKRRWPTASAANFVAAASNSRHPDSTVVAYPCPHCDGWHLGNA
jgi:hypothetical protein